MTCADPISIRQADWADLDAVQQISAEAYIPAYIATLGAVPKPAIEDYRPRIDRGEVWLLEADGNQVALIVLEERPDHFIVYSIAVRPAHQGRGRASKLLRFAEQRAYANGLRELRLYTNSRMDRNIEICRHCGFVETGTRPHPSRDGKELVDMVKRIATPPAFS